MAKKKVNQKEMIQLLKTDENPEAYQVVFNDFKVEALDAILLGKNGFLVPKDLIWYDEDKINYEDIPPMTDEDLETGRLVRVLTVKVPLEKAIIDWIKAEKIDLDKLVPDLIKKYYSSLAKMKKPASR